MDRWEFVDEAFQYFLKLASVDRLAHDRIVAQLERLGRRGSSGNDQRSVQGPVGFISVVRSVKDPPWMGEIKETESAASRSTTLTVAAKEYRLYFIDIESGPSDPPHMFLVTWAGEKKTFTGRDAERKTREAQDRDIRYAMEIGKRWCRTNQRQYRGRSTSTM